jgi:hypothetical protein
MSKMEPPVDWRHAGRPGADPDGLLGAFFKAELPDPWPACRRPGDRVRSTTPSRQTSPSGGPPRGRTWTAARSRLALAASVALLLLGTLLLSGKFHGSPPEANFGPQRAKPYWKESLRPYWKESLRQGQDQPTELLIQVYEP